MTDEELREQVRQTLAKHRAGYTGYVYATDDALADALIPLVAKAQRADDVEWLTPALSGAPAYRDLLRALTARPLISEVPR